MASGTDSSATARQALGQRGEAYAASHLIGLGYTVLARNWRHGALEIDIVAQDGSFLVLVEVRTRQRQAGQPLTFGAPEESITVPKRRRMSLAAETYLAMNPWSGPVRIDVVVLEIGVDGTLLRLTQYKDAIGGTQR